MKYLRLALSTVFLAVLLTMVSSPPAFAARFIADNNVNLAKTIHDDVYVSGGEIDINSDIDGDLMVVGGNVRVKGDITGDLFVAGGTVFIDGNIGNTARVCGGTVTFKGRIERDLLEAGGTLLLNKRSFVGGDAIASGGSFEAMGKIEGDVKGGFGDAKFDGPVGGNVKLDVERLTIASGARIEGNLDYTSKKKADISPGSVAGKVSRHKPPKPKAAPVGMFIGWLWSLVSMLVVGLVVAWLFPASLKLTKESLVKQPWAALGIGFATLFLAPIVLIFSICTIIGIPLALIGIAAYVIAIYLAQIYGATALGSLVVDRGSEKWIGVSTLLGVAVLSLVKLIPIAGGLITFFLILFGLGAMVLAAWSKRRHD